MNRNYKKHVFMLLAGFMVSTGLFAQSGYYAISNLHNPGNPKGLLTAADAAIGGAEWTDIIAINQATEVYSSAQTIPFTFKFNDVDVTQFLASSTGYITFDLTATGTPTSNNVSLPSATIPNKSICVWGVSGSGQFARTRTQLLGAAPNRQLYIQFFACTTPGVTGSLNIWSIVLEETTNRIYIVDQYSFANAGTYSDPNLTVGIQIDATTAVQLAGSPSLKSGNKSATGASPSDNDSYEFVPGIQPAYDVRMVQTDMPPTVTVNSPITIAGKFQNTGSQAITALKTTYSVDGGTAIAEDISVASVASGALGSYTLSTGFTPTKAGAYNVFKIWTSNLNGTNADEKTIDDSITSKVFVNTGLTGIKRVLFEEFSTAPCQFCPDGAVVIEQMESNHEETQDIIVVQHHAGFGTDKMTIAEHNVYAAAYAAGAPTAMVDRKLFAGEEKVAFSRNLWAQRAESELETITPVDVILDHSYDTATRTITATVSARFVDYALGDLRLNLFIVQDSVTGKGTGYDQVNYYNTQTGHPYFGKGNPAKGYVHRKVVRAVPTTAWGEKDIIGTNPGPDSIYSKTYTYKLPITYYDGSIRLVGFVTQHDEANVNSRPVLNAAQQKLNLGTVGVAEIGKFNGSVNIYPNPFSQSTTVELAMTESSAVNMEVFNLLGEKVYSSSKGILSPGNYRFNWNGTSSEGATLSSGLYLVKISAGNAAIINKVSLLK